MNHLSTDDIEQLAGQLQSQRQTILAAIRERLHQGDAAGEMALANHFAEVREQAEADLLNDTEIAQLQLALADLEDIDAALARIGNGNYGACIGCGEAIALSRLHAQPAAKLCLACKEPDEQHRPLRAKPGP